MGQSIRERVDAICTREDITLYRLAQLLRMDQQALRKDSEGKQPMRWVLQFVEDNGLSYFQKKEEELGKFVFKK